MVIENVLSILETASERRHSRAWQTLASGAANLNVSGCYTCGLAIPLAVRGLGAVSSRKPRRNVDKQADDDDERPHASESAPCDRL